MAKCGFFTLLASLLFSVDSGRVLASCYLWIEVGGDAMRGQMLMKSRVGDTVTVNGFGVEEPGLRKPLGTVEDATNRIGYEIVFRDVSMLILSKHEMGGLDDFLITLADQIKQQG